MYSAPWLRDVSNPRIASDQLRNYDRADRQVSAPEVAEEDRRCAV